MYHSQCERYKISKHTKKQENVTHTQEKRQSIDSNHNPDIEIGNNFKVATVSMLKMTKENMFVINDQIGNFSREL